MTGNRELFINGYIETIASKFQQSPDPQKNRNLAFEILSMAIILDKPFEEVYNSIQVKGSEDGGFDGIYFDDQGDYYIMHVFQCKNTTTIKQNEIDKFRGNYVDIFENANRVGRKNLSDVQKWIDEYIQITNNRYIIEPKLYFVFNGLKNDPSATMNETLFQTFHKPSEGFQIIDADDLYAKIGSLAKMKRDKITYTFCPEKSNVSLRDNQALYSFAISNIKAVNFRIKATDICELIENEIKVNGTYDFLFEENIRSFLSYRAKANQRMKETLENIQDAVYFPFLNNGITMICDELTIPSAPQSGEYMIPVKNPQIVNGLQTSVVLYRMYKSRKENLDNVFVNVRIYETRDASLLEKITDATNTQTPINYRDKVSTKKFAEYLQTIFKNAGIFLVTKRGETFSPRSQKDFDEHVNIDTVIKYWYATYFEKPETSKDSISFILQEVYDATTSDKHQLKEFFDGNKDSSIYKQMLNAYQIYRFVQSKKESQRSTYPFVSYADELLSYGIYKDIGNNTEPETMLNNSYDKVIKTINKITENERLEYESKQMPFNLSAYFKKPRCRIEYNKEAGLLENDNLIEELKKA